MSQQVFSLKFSQLITEYDSVQTNINSGMEVSTGVACDLMESFSSLDNILETPLEITQLKELIKNYYKLSHNLNTQKNTLSNLKNGLLEDPKFTTDYVSYFEQEINSEINTFDQKSENDKYSDCDALHEFNERIFNIIHPDQNYNPENIQQNSDNDIQMISEKQSFKCPITTQIFENPCRSQKCNHAYSEDAIVQLIRSNKNQKTECPVAGCKHYVSFKDLIPDKRLKRQVALEYKRLQANNHKDEQEYITI